MNEEKKDESKKWIVIANWPGQNYQIGEIIDESAKLIWRDLFKVNPDDYPHLFKIIIT